MSENLAVLFRLGKALRRHDAGNFMQQYDSLVEQEGLSDYTLMNHKEVVRQISELDSEDFSLLECAVGEASMKRPGSGCRSRKMQRPLHVGLEAEDLEDSSIAEQLEALLERLRLESKRRVSSDSGAVSDLESCSVTTLDEDCHLRQNSEKCLPLDTPCGEVSGRVEVPTETRGSRNEATNSSAGDGPTPNFGGIGRGRPVAGKNSDTVKMTHCINRQRVAYTKRGRKNALQGDLEVSSHQNVVEKTTPVKEMGRSRDVEQTPQTEVVQNHNHRQDKSELKPSEKTSLSTDQQVVVGTQEPNTEDSSSPTEGGPFITHWSKGRLKRSGNSCNTRDYYSNRRPHNSQYNRCSRQKFGGVNQQRYSSKGHFTSGRDIAQSSHRNDVPLRQKGGEAVAHHRTGRPRDKLERDKSPHQRREQQPAVSVPKNISSVPVAVAPSVQSNALTPSQMPPEDPPPPKLSYASVTGFAGKIMASAITKPPPPCNGIKEQRDAPSNVPTDTAVNEERATSNYSTKDQRATSRDVAKEVRASVSNGINEQQITTSDDVRCFYRDIAASFNYNEVVEFLMKGWKEVESEMKRDLQSAVQ